MSLQAMVQYFLSAIGRDNDRGATVVEYALLVALIAIVVIGGITAFGGSLTSFFSDLGDNLPAVTTTAP